MVSQVKRNKPFLSVPEFGGTLMASTDGFNQSDTRRKHLPPPPEKKKAAYNMTSIPDQVKFLLLE